jgi:hypothetical protein
MAECKIKANPKLDIEKTKQNNKLEIKKIYHLFDIIKSISKTYFLLKIYHLFDIIKSISKTYFF